MELLLNLFWITSCQVNDTKSMLFWCFNNRWVDRTTGRQCNVTLATIKFCSISKSPWTMWRLWPKMAWHGAGWSMFICCYLDEASVFCVKSTDWYISNGICNNDINETGQELHIIQHGKDLNSTLPLISHQLPRINSKQKGW